MEMDISGARVIRHRAADHDRLSIAEGQIIADPVGRVVDLTGFTVLPGIIDLHGDGFERHVAPRRGAMKDVSAGLLAAEAEMAANGITTGFIAQFISWEGGLRGEDFADQVFTALRHLDTITDLHAQVRFETHLLDLYAQIPAWLDRWQAHYIVFNDHLPHDRLAQGKEPPRMVGQALKAGRNPQAHFALLQELHARSGDVPAALDALCATLRAKRVRMGSHDDHTPDDRLTWQARGVEIAEFPETLQAAEAPGHVILGAPNLVRGGSHKGNLSALDAVMTGTCDALASDYHYPSPLRAALFLAKTFGLPEAWRLVSEGPARIMGFADRGRLEPGLRADMVILDAQDRVAGTLSKGRVSYMRGDVAERLLAS